MDELARELSMSKRTLYEIFGDKNTLVKSTLELFIEKEKEDLQYIVENSNDAINEMALLSLHLNKIFMSLNPAVMFDMKKFHKDAHEMHESFKHECLYNCISNNIERGKKEGYYRNSLRTDILTRMRLAHFELVFEPDVYPHEEFVLYDVHSQLFTHFLLGMVTPQGYELYEKYNKDGDNE
jgi:AcrR family transcriptional regulator